MQKIVLYSTTILLQWRFGDLLSSTRKRRKKLLVSKDSLETGCGYITEGVKMLFDAKTLYKVSKFLTKRNIGKQKSFGSCFSQFIVLS